MNFSVRFPVLNQAGDVEEIEMAREIEMVREKEMVRERETEMVRGMRGDGNILRKMVTSK